MRRAWSIRPEFDAFFHEFFLDLDGEKLPTTISLKSLDGKRHFINNAINKIQRIGHSSTSVQSQYSITRTVIDSSVLIQIRGNLTGIHLYPITRKRSRIANEVLLFALFDQEFDLMLF